MLPVVPKRRYEQKVKELSEANKDVELYKCLVKRYEKLTDETIKHNGKIQLELDEAKESLKIEQNTNNRLCEIVQIYESKELSKIEKEISRLEQIANRTKSPYTKLKIENRILKIKEMAIKRGLYEDK